MNIMINWRQIGCAAFSCILALSAPILKTARAAEHVDIVGWPLPDLSGEAPNFALGDDSVFGRQICPPLMRLNLATQRSEDLLIRHVLTDGEAGKGRNWSIELRSGLYWWSGTPITSGDLVTFVRDHLEAIVAERSANLWEVPKFKVETKGDLGIIIDFDEPPLFGPYILSGVPLFHPASASGLRFECAGLYHPTVAAHGMTLLPTPGYHSKKPLPELHLYKPGAAPANNTDAPRLALDYANSIHSSSLPPKTPAAHCSRTLDLPYATMIVWNTTKSPTANVEMRHILSQLIPRSALVSAGAAALADVASAPVPRQHPGYNSQIALRPFDMHSASQGLSRLGYTRKTAASPRVDAKEQPMRLVIISQSESSGLVEKVIADAFAAVGISVQFRATKSLEAADEAMLAEADGILATYALDWPRANFIGNFHSKKNEKSPFWRLADRDLDQALERYALSLTHALPDFSALTAVHRRLADLEPVTVLMEHKACLDGVRGLKLTKGSLNQKDPDWFRQLLF